MLLATLSGPAPHSLLGGPRYLTGHTSCGDSARSARTGAKRGPDAPQPGPGGRSPALE